MEWNVGPALKFLWSDRHDCTDLWLRGMVAAELSF